MTTREDLERNFTRSKKQLGTTPTSKKAVKKKAPPPPTTTATPAADTSKAPSTWQDKFGRILQDIFYKRKGDMVKGYARGGGVRPADNEYR